MGLYKVTGPTPVLDANPGDTLEHDFTADEEADLLDRGRVELVPQKYKLLEGQMNLAGVAYEPGDTFDAAFTVPEEQSHLASGRIAHVKTAAGRAAKPKKKEG